ncbi:MAG TPA: hypothetical protein VHR43_09165 [Gemmatimonadales bacterium]|nr:hypothetical protein [Gemmatimonadales bacterium]
MRRAPQRVHRWTAGALAATALFLARPGPAGAVQLSGVLDLGAGSATWDRSGSGISLTRGALDAAYRAPAILGLSPEITGGFGASTDPAARTALRWDLGGRLSTLGPETGGWLAAAIGRAGVGAPSVGVSRLESGLRHTFGPAGLQLWVSRTAVGARTLPGGVSDTLSGTDTLAGRRLADYTDLGSRATIGVGGIEVAMLVVRRLGTAGLRRVAWETSAVWWLAPGVGLAGAAGHSLPQFGLAVPGARYGTLGLRLALGAEPRRRNREPPAPVAGVAPAVARLIVTPDHRLTIIGPPAARAEVRGDFTDWTPRPLVALGAGRWQLPGAVAPGVHHLDVRFDDGPWLVPGGTVSTDDGFGGRVGMVVVP